MDHSTAASVYHILSPELVKSNIILTASIGVHSIRIAEFVMALILNVAKKIPVHIKLQQKKRRQSIQADELKGKIVGILGYGHIGKEVAKRALSFEMKVMAIKRSYSPDEDKVTLLQREDLHDLLKTCDFLVVCAPLTRETVGLIGEAEMATMKKDAYIINITRGGVVNEKALIKALKEKWIAGACLDVFVEQPLLYSFPNVVITHCSAYSSPNSQREVFDLFLANLKRFITGEEMQCIVDKERGY